MPRLPGTTCPERPPAVEVAIGKSINHLPLERQVKMMKLEGLIVGPLVLELRVAG